MQADLGRPPTRDEFRTQVGTSPIEKQFGTFSALCIAVNGSCRTVKSKLDKEMDKYEITTATLEKSYKTDLKPWHEKYNKGDSVDMVVIFSSDHHAQYYDPFSWFVYVDTCRRIQPTVAILGGDVLDCYAVSSYNKDPRRLYRDRHSVFIPGRQPIDPGYCARAP